jgi:Pyruvate/2-oxoacid:ferredoxin oxidoreductase gamma subunit
MDELGFQTGLVHEEDRPEFAAAYREHGSAFGEPTRATALPLETRFRSLLPRPLRLLVAGSAGGRVRSATRCLARAGLLSGLWATQHDDYPVTVRTGHSLSELVLSPEEILHGGSGAPDAVLVLSAEGLACAGRRLRTLAPDARVFTLPRCGDPVTDAAIERLDLGLASVRSTSNTRTLMALAAVARRLELVPEAALAEATRRGAPARCDANLAAIAAGWSLPAPSESPLRRALPPAGAAAEADRHEED